MYSITSSFYEGMIYFDKQKIFVSTTTRLQKLFRRLMNDQEQTENSQWNFSSWQKVHSLMSIFQMNLPIKVCSKQKHYQGGLLGWHTRVNGLHGLCSSCGVEWPILPAQSAPAHPHFHRTNWKRKFAELLSWPLNFADGREFLAQNYVGGLLATW